MNKIKIHKFIECAIPIKSCNMRCKYCYVTQNKWWDSAKPDYTYCKSKIRDAFSAERLGGICMFNMCAAGETLIDYDVVEILQQILENGHFVMLVTNGTLTKRFEEICEFPYELRQRLFFKFSFHYLELKRLNILEKYFQNVKMVHDAGISFTVELTPDDSYVPYISEIKEVCMENLGVLCHITVPRDETKMGYPLMTSMRREEFVNTWKSFDSELFNFKESIFEIPRREFCYAGMWSFTVDLLTGDYAQCYGGKKLGNLYDDVKSPIKEMPIGCNCPEGHCFNGHAFLGFGLIPELRTPDYADMRNRIVNDNEQWLSKSMEAAMRCKLIDNNSSCTNQEKRMYNIKSFNIKKKVKKALGIKK